MRMFGHGHRWGSIEDPQRVLEMIQDLLVEQSEFHLKVDGASTLPYAGELRDLAPKKERMTVKLMRPLPWDLPSGSRFQMTFNAQEGRFDAPTALRGRRDYLQYDFSLPHAYRPADRRAHPRYPFRPRENVQVLARAGGNLGLLGMLVNLSMGGLGMRVDRILRLDDGLRLPVGPEPFQSGLFLPSIRIQNLPRLPLLELQGAVVRTEELREGLLLGVAFADMEPREREILLSCLALRAELHGKGEAEGSRCARVQVPELPAAAPAPFTCVPLDLPLDPLDLLTPLQRLQRRSARILVLVRPEARRDELMARLARHGFWRIVCLEDLATLQACPRTTRDLLLVEAESVAHPGEEPLVLARRLQAGFTPVPSMVLLTPENDPTLALAQSSTLRFLPPEAPEETWWMGALDDLLEGGEEPQAPS